MPELLTLVTQQESLQKAPSWLRERQQAGQHAWQASSWPTRKTEDWKYTSLWQFGQEQFVHQVSQPDSGLNVPALGGTMLVFVDGFFREDLSNLSNLKDWNWCASVTPATNRPTSFVPG